MQKGKILAGMLTSMLLVASMGMTVFAANSPTSDAAMSEAVYNKITASGAEVAGKSVSVTTKASDATTYAEAKQEAATAATASNKTASVKAMADITVDADTAKTISASNPITVTITAQDITNPANVYILHKKSDGKWEKITPSYTGSNGTYAFKFKLTSLSPVAVVEEAASDDSSNGNGSGTNTGNTNTSSNSNDNSNSGTQSNSQTNSQSNPQTNNNNQSNSQTNNNNQNNPVNVSQNVTVVYPESYYDGDADYEDGYSDGYTDGTSTVKSSTAVVYSTSASTSTTSAGGSAVSPKTGASQAAMPLAAVALLAGLVVCGRKARNN